MGKKNFGTLLGISFVCLSHSHLVSHNSFAKFLSSVFFVQLPSYILSLYLFLTATCSGIYSSNLCLHTFWQQGNIGKQRIWELRGVWEEYKGKFVPNVEGKRVRVRRQKEKERKGFIVQQRTSHGMTWNITVYEYVSCSGLLGRVSRNDREWGFCRMVIYYLKTKGHDIYHAWQKTRDARPVSVGTLEGEIQVKGNWKSIDWLLKIRVFTHYKLINTVAQGWDGFHVWRLMSILSLLNLKEISTLILFQHLRLCLPKCLLKSGFATTCMHFFSLLTWATSFANIIPPDLISLVICGKEYKHEVPLHVIVSCHLYF